MKTIQVATLDNNLYDGVEWFTVRLSEPVNAGFVGRAATLDGTAEIRDEDDAPPLMLARATVDGATLTLHYDTKLNLHSVPAAGDITVLVDGVERGIYFLAARGSTVTVVLEEAVANGQVVTVSYQPGSNPIRTSLGRSTAAFSRAQVTNSTPAAPPSGTDKAALVAFFNATGGVNWRQERNWRSAEPLDQWHGVTVDSDGRVTSLELDDNRLKGIVPADVIQLAHLRKLVITSNEACLPGDGSFSEWLPQVEFEGAFCPPEESIIDLAVFYTPAVRARLGNARFVETSAESKVLEVNRIFADSGVGIRLSIALIEETDYDEGTGSLRTANLRLSGKADGHMDEVHAKRDAVGADLVHLLTVSTSGDAMGVSGSPAAISVKSADEAFSASFENSAAFTLAHELGHTLGIRHDRHVDCRTGVTCRAPSYPYGYGFVNQRGLTDSAPASDRWYTIMAYNTQCRDFSCRRIPRFSNPYATFNGHPLGVGGDERIVGVDGPSNAVRALNNARETVSKYRSRVATPAGLEGERFVAPTWSLIPEGIGMGDSFRLLFVTSTRRAGSLSSIDAFDRFARLNVRSGHAGIQSYTEHFKVVGSTSALDARVHTGTTYSAEVPGVPIYWLDGAKVADNYSDFYDGTWDSNAPRLGTGLLAPAAVNVLTGSNSDGTKFAAQYLGTAEGNTVRVGKPGTSGQELDSGHNVANTETRAFYALSGIFTVLRTQGVPSRPTLYVAPQEVTEDSGPTEITVTVTLPEPEFVDKTVRLQVQDGTASSPEDFTADPSTLTVTVPARTTTATGTFSLTPVNEDGGDPECEETVIVTHATGALTVVPASVTLRDPNADALRCSMASLQRPAISLNPDSAPNPAAESEIGDRSPASPAPPPTQAKMMIWTDRTDYALGQPVRLYRSLDPRGDTNTYTFLYYLENLGTGRRFYFAPGIRSTSLESDPVDHFGMGHGTFQPRRIERSEQQLSWAGVLRTAGPWHFVAELRSPDAKHIVKAAHAKFVVSAQPPKVIGEDGMPTVIRTVETWTSDTIYKLRQPVYVRAGATLRIGAGTLIQGLGPDAAIIVEKGGRIAAHGTRQAPVVMTCDAPVGYREPGCWGGLRIQGAATVASPEDSPARVLAEEPKSYGGDKPEDSSGVLRFVRVEFAGAGPGADAPRAALAFHGVGSGMVIDYVQAHASLGDGIEFRGGDAHCSHCVSTGARDDGLEWSQGWLGTAQHLFVQQGPEGDSGIEANGPTAGESASQRPALYNMTLVGGASLGSVASSGNGIHLGAGAAVTLRNVVLTGFGRFALSAESEAAASFTDRRSSLQNAILHGNGGMYGVAQIQEAVSPYVQFIDKGPQLRNTRYEANPDPRPESGSVALRTDAATAPPSHGAFSGDAQFLGAFGSINWIEEWAFIGPESDYRVAARAGTQD